MAKRLRVGDVEPAAATLLVQRQAYGFFEAPIGMLRADPARTPQAFLRAEL